MVKKINLLLIILISTLFILPLANARPFDFGTATEITTNVINNILSILSPIFQEVIGEYDTSDFFFSKVLLLILLIIILKNIIDRTPISEGNGKIGLLISVIISIISIRFMNENEFFEAIFIQYGVLGIAITTILPMVIFFYFIHNTNVGTFGRKVFWMIYTVILTGIWIVKSSEIPEVANWIYGITILLTITFIFLDKSIHSYFGMSDFNKLERRVNKKMIRKAFKELDEMKEDTRAGRMSVQDYNRESKELKDYIKELSKE